VASFELYNFIVTAGQNGGLEYGRFRGRAPECS